MFANFVVEAAQDVHVAADQRDVAAKPGEYAGELDRDVAATVNEDALRKLRQMKGFIGRDRVFAAGNFRPHVGPRAGRYQNGFCAHTSAGRQAHRLCVLQHRARSDELDFVTLQRIDIGRLKPGNLPILVGNQCWPMKGRLWHRPTVTGGIFKLTGKPGCVNQKLFRDAPPNDAGAANAVFFCDHDTGAVARCDARGAHTTRACTNDEKIDVVVRHQLPPSLRKDGRILSRPISP